MCIVTSVINQNLISCTMMHVTLGHRYSTMYSCSIACCGSMCSEKEITKKVFFPAGFELSALACEARALPSELLGGVNLDTNASKASVGKN